MTAVAPGEYAVCAHKGQLRCLAVHFTGFGGDGGFAWGLLSEQNMIE